MADADTKLVADADLTHCNSLRVAGRARFLAALASASAVPEWLADPRFAGLPVLVLGAGSNVLLTGDFPGLVLQLKTADIRLVADDGERVTVRAEAGVCWQDLVQWSLAQGLVGLENLSLIPGSCGAAPIQNIGAYGVELSDHLEAVEVWDRQQQHWHTLPRADCALAYRDSCFKRQPGRYIVTAIRLRLARSAALHLDYAGLREELLAMQVASADAASVAQAVVRLRQRKLPDPAQLPNAGSFFKNPLVTSSDAAALAARHPALPQWPQSDGRVKLSAAWLIEHIGGKGSRHGDAGIAPGHALVLVNYGRASGLELLAFARSLQNRVEAAFQVRLEPEPVII
ncbi:MAG: UDP-N-acetylenolpyruvoylglucosamine reductase [Lysobacterales bacterium CG02_land_8_20_14_3_00_62_12]|nr:MAG: UDP-N-acetylenolpyruvoylglucosamine reductase [Xanthomonadales bacterium CG02_land_8_20_14_3_00_62_12]PJA39972.1 MAG: UDP-N-acetylenolpyruvoylglucosamine reductase [Xanthomonadales bacterium CG_4_9_14_3_um_filter_62_6]